MSGSETAEASPRRRLKREVVHERREARACVPLEGRPEATSSTSSKSNPTRELVQLAWPIAAAMLGETAIGLVDTKLVGGLGPGALGGVGIATTLMFLGYSVVFGIMRGVKVRTAHAIGEGRPLDGFVYARSGVLMGAVTGVVIMVACRDVSGVLRLLGADPAIVPYARDFRRDHARRAADLRPRRAHPAPAGHRRLPHPHGGRYRRKHLQRALRVGPHLRALRAAGLRRSWWRLGHGDDGDPRARG